MPSGSGAVWYGTARRQLPTTPAPEKWDTEEVMGWLKTHSPLDASMEDALRMARVTGKSLQQLAPNTLYKAMRRHWLHPDRPVEALDPSLLQETAMLSFHYGAPPADPDAAHEAVRWVADYTARRTAAALRNQSDPPPPPTPPGP
eukprot:TRINITY_DN9288_c0_g1_i1.p1 TRINITY_DN9288_c0_g1~~TRINITY_DN9288_c0_g1_i1.p1  ORF type:complete len:145 (+),score=33.56 TRINITY_DN9288_c0_g1_i1:74-508(+)